MRNMPYLLDAAELTILLSGGGLVLGVPLGLILCAARMSAWQLSRRIAAVYISFFRGVPLLVQLLAVFYLLPQLGFSLPVFISGILSLGLCTAAYSAEIMRGALQTVPYGQAEAGAALGLNPWIIWWRIRFPQALRIALPPLVNESILVVKASSLASVIGLPELTRVTQNIAGQSFHYAEIYLTAGLLYLVINSILSTLGTVAERRMTPPSRAYRHGS